MSVLLQHETKQPTVHKVESSDDEAPGLPKHEQNVRVTDAIPSKHNFAGRISMTESQRGIFLLSLFLFQQTMISNLWTAMTKTSRFLSSVWAI